MMINGVKVNGADAVQPNDGDSGLEQVNRANARPLNHREGTVNARGKSLSNTAKVVYSGVAVLLGAFVLKSEKKDIVATAMAGIVGGTLLLLAVTAGKACYAGRAFKLSGESYRLNTESAFALNIYDKFMTASKLGKGITDEEDAAMVTSLIDASSDDQKKTLADVFCNLMSHLPEGIPDDMKYHFLCGAHVVCADADFTDFVLSDREKSALINRSHSSSHYSGEKVQYGMNLDLDGRKCHLLFGKTDDNKLFMQFEGNAAYSGVGETVMHLGTAYDHLLDYFTHKSGSGAQVGPLGLSDASEKSHKHFIVKDGEMQKAELLSEK